MKKVLTAVLVAVVAIVSVVSLVACGNNDDGKDKFVVATNAEFAPFEYMDGDKFYGVDMEIAKIIADKLGQELVIKNMDFDAVCTSVGKNGVDVAMAGLTVNETRKQSVNFTDSYYNASQVLVVKESNTAFDNCETVADVEAILNAGEYKIGCQSGTTAQYYIEGDEDWDFPGITGATCQGYQNAGLAVKDMQNGQIDLVIVDEAPANAIVKSINGSNAEKVKVINIKLTEEEYAFGVDKAQPELLQKINDILAEIKEDGTFQKIMDKYFNGEEVEGIVSAD